MLVHILKDLRISVQDFLIKPEFNTPELHAARRDLRRDMYIKTVPYTTRQKRPNEVDGQQYRFVSKEAFMEMVKRGELIEYGEHNGNLYGTPRESKSSTPISLHRSVSVAHVRQTTSFHATTFTLEKLESEKVSLCL